MGSKLEVKRGAYGKSKCKAFSVMSDGNWWPSKQLCILCGISYPSLGRAFSRWLHFGYVDRQPILMGGKYEYHLTIKGKRWLSLARQYLPGYNGFIDELAGWQRNLTDEAIDELLNVPFNEFIDTLDARIKDFQKSRCKKT